MGKLGFSSQEIGKKLSIAFVAFNKHIETEIKQKLMSPHTMFEGTDEQNAIWHEAIHGTRHIVVNAVAGSGKTSTALQYCRKVSADVQPMTYHSLGFRALRNTFGRVELDQYKVDGILDHMEIPVHEDKQHEMRGFIKRLVSLSKQYGRQDRKNLDGIIDRHDIEVAPDDQELLTILAVQVLDTCKAQTWKVDFDDMVWLPKALDLKLRQYDFMITDESQDLNEVQQWLALNSASRHMVIGDKHQAIYGFRGASSNSMDLMRNALLNTGRQVVELPLSYTRRCPKSHVALARRVYDGINALDEAPAGVIRYESVATALERMKPGDLVLCRVNADLLSVAYKLLKKKIPAVVRGRDIGQGLKRLVEKCEKYILGRKRGAVSVDEVLRVAGEITGQEVRKFEAMKEKGLMRMAAAQDRYECLVELGVEAKDSAELKRRIDSLFESDENGMARNAVVLGTVHRTKGLEAERVFVLRPELIPHPMARRKEDKQQERNIFYIAVTRAKYDGKKEGELVFVGGESPLCTDDGEQEYRYKGEINGGR